MANIGVSLCFVMTITLKDQIGSNNTEHVKIAKSNSRVKEGNWHQKIGSCKKIHRGKFANFDQVVGFVADLLKPQLLKNSLIENIFMDFIALLKNYGSSDQTKYLQNSLQIEQH